MTLASAIGSIASARAESQRGESQRAESPRIESLSTSDASAIRTVIQAQLDALAVDDAIGAFSLASPAIQALFATPARFLEMVRHGYPVVHHPGSVRFLRPQRRDDQVLQGVRMTDAQGRPWLALYSMQRQPDGQWRINGCQVAAGESLDI